METVNQIKKFNLYLNGNKYPKDMPPLFSPWSENKGGGHIFKEFGWFTFRK